MKAFRELAADGRPVLAVLLSEAFSSTIRTAELAAKEMDDADITIINSGSNAMGLGFLVLAAARAARDGARVGEAINLIEGLKKSTGVLFSVPDLDHLRRGGRIRYARSLLGAALAMVPILSIENGPIRVAVRVRTREQALERLIDLVGARLGQTRPLRIAVLHADAERAAWGVQKAVDERLRPDELIIFGLNEILAIHAGPDAVGLAYSAGA